MQQRIQFHCMPERVFQHSVELRTSAMDCQRGGLESVLLEIGVKTEAK